MGNFSRDTFKLTNSLNDLLGRVDTPVVDPRQYVGVRLQQGVPIIDADWNELEDVRRMELMALVRFFIGNGVPAGDQGFRISTTVGTNNFSIAKGIILVDGLLVINGALTTYLAQPNAGGLPALTKPPADRMDIVYLETWELEVTGDVGDTRLINSLVGVQTAARLQREWVVRVQENASDLSGIVREKGHNYSSLARLNRRAAVDTITGDMIFDLRKTGITVAEHIKVPIFLEVGLETIDVARFAEMLSGLRTSLFARLRGGLLPHQTANATDENIVLIALQEAMNRAHVGEVQATSRNMDNQDALLFMQGLYDVQKDFLDVLTSIGNVANAAQAFITEYTKRLDGSAADLIKGLKLALTNQDLLSAVIAQEEINNFLSAPVDNLPEGDVLAIYQSVVPFEAIAAGPYAFSFKIRSEVTLPAANTEDFNIQVITSPSSWTAVPDKAKVTLQNQGGEDTVVVTVSPNAIDNQSTLTVVAVAARNPLLKSTQPGLNLQIGFLPPVGAFLFYAGPRLNGLNQLEIPKANITSAAGVPIRFAISNNSPTQTRTYSVSYFITLDSASTAGWSPLQATPNVQTVTIPPVQPPVSLDARIKAPAAVVTDTTGVLNITGKLTQIDGANVTNGESVTVQIAFIVK
jgi:hypothetical protein